MWWPAGSQAVDRFVWQISALGLGWLPIPRFGSVRAGTQPLIRLRKHPPEVSGVGAQPGFWVCAPTQVLFVCVPRQLGRLSGRVPTRGFRYGTQATDWGMHPLGHFGSGAQAAGQFIRAHAHPEFQLWAPSPLIWVRASPASGERWGCFSAVTVQGRKGEGRQKPRLLWRVF